MVRLIPDAIVQPGAGGIVQRAPLVQASEDFTAADGTAITALALPWTKHATGATNTAAPTVQSGRVVGENAATTSLYYRNDVGPVSANYHIECDVVQKSAAGSVGISSRIVTGANTFYSARFSAAIGWRLFKVVAGTPTQIGSTVANVLTNDQPYRVALDVVESSLVMWVDGVPIISGIDTAITAAGKAGIFIFGAMTTTTGYHLDNWRVVQ
jgi:hypothetical protein